MARHPYSRRTFLRGASALAAASLFPRAARAQVPDRGPRLDLDLVEQTVRVAHFDLDALAALVADEPALANACHDWGGGDFETPLGAASHMGRADIARHLLARGARVDIFCATMLGEVATVRALLDWDLSLAATRGPHGLTLMHHARQGGSEAMIALLTEHDAG